MGAAVALGLVREGATVLMVDRVSKIHKASRGNFGLVWSQSKGSGNRPYARLSEKAVRAFDGFAREIEAESGIDVELRLGAGLVLSIGEQELAARTAVIEKMHAEAAAWGKRTRHRCSIETRSRNWSERPPLGEAVSGGSFSHIDGDVNPLLLLKAMRKVFIKKGGNFVQGCKVDGICPGRAIITILLHPLAILRRKSLSWLQALAISCCFQNWAKRFPWYPRRVNFWSPKGSNPFSPFPSAAFARPAVAAS
jgi:glycine/D-amino acid oxidase-like deaminating enzyme